MTIQYSGTHRTNSMTQLNTDIGANAQIKVYSGSIPANVAASAGTLLVQYAGNAGGFGTAASQQLTASAVANATASGGGGGTTATYFRAATSGGTDVVQGTVFESVALTTNALTAANSAVLNFASTTGVLTGMAVSGTGVPVGATVVATTGTTVTISTVSTAGVSNSTAITFNGDMTATNTSIATGQTCAFTSLVITATGA